MNDKVFVTRSLEGDTDAFGTLVKRHYGTVRGLAAGYLNDIGLADDVAQEAFIAAFTDLSSLRDADQFRSWVCSIATNLCRMQLRKPKVEESGIDPDTMPGLDLSPDEVYEREERRRQILGVLDSLPEGEKEAVVLYYLLGERVDSVSESLDISKNAVKVRLHRGRQRLKQELIAMDEKSDRVDVESFADWSKLTDEEMCATLCETYTKDLAIALAKKDNAARRVEDKVMRNISKRVQGIMQGFIEERSPSAAEIDRCRTTILKTIHELQSAGTIRPSLVD